MVIYHTVCMVSYSWVISSWVFPFLVCGSQRWTCLICPPVCLITSWHNTAVFTLPFPIQYQIWWGKPLTGQRGRRHIPENRKSSAPQQCAWLFSSSFVFLFLEGECLPFKKRSIPSYSEIQRERSEGCFCPVFPSGTVVTSVFWWAHVVNWNGCLAGETTWLNRMLVRSISFRYDWIMLFLRITAWYLRPDASLMG